MSAEGSLEALLGVRCPAGIELQAQVRNAARAIATEFIPAGLPCGLGGSLPSESQRWAPMVPGHAGRGLHPSAPLAPGYVRDPAQSDERLRVGDARRPLCAAYFLDLESPT